MSYVFNAEIDIITVYNELMISLYGIDSQISLFFS